MNTLEIGFYVLMLICTIIITTFIVGVSLKGVKKIKNKLKK